MSYASGFDTIAAISTPSGKSGIGIIRVSGPEAVNIVVRNLKSENNLNFLKDFSDRKIVYSHIVDNNGDIIDEVLISFFPVNKSFTGELTVEINCHGGKEVLKQTLELIFRSGARPAGPGEFTKRAFKNGRISLIQAEAIHEIIQAKNVKSLKSAWKIYHGELQKNVSDIIAESKFFISKIEAIINFEVVSHDDFSILELSEILLKIIRHTSELISKSSSNRIYRDGIHVALTGPPNAGKSSIFNEILNEERSLVCDFPGTTRDYLSETIELDGFEVVFTDTAGIRQTSDLVEIGAIHKSEEILRNSDLIVTVMDSSVNYSAEQMSSCQKNLNNGGFLVFNKSDLPLSKTNSEFFKINSGENIFFISCLRKNGIELLLDRISEKIANDYGGNIEIFTTIHQRKLIFDFLFNLEKISKVLKDSYTDSKLDIIAEEMKIALKNLSNLVGDVSSEVFLDEIFNKFCIGK